MSYHIPGLGTSNGTHNGSDNTDTSFLVQQLLDQVQQNEGEPLFVEQNEQSEVTPAPASVKQETDPAEQGQLALIPAADSPVAEDNNAVTKVEGLPIEVPQCLIFGGETGEDEFLIPGRCLQKLPQEVLANLLQTGERMGSFHRLGSIPHWESMVRLNHFLDHGDYKPFKPALPVEFIDASGNPRPYENRDSSSAVEMPKSTLNLFLHEIDLYQFASRIGYTDLRRFSAERLCKSYPKSYDTIIILIEIVAPLAQQNDDRDLVQKIIEYVNTNCRRLTGMPQFLTMLRKVTRGRPPVGPAMLEAYISASEALRREAMNKNGAASVPITPATLTPASSATTFSNSVAPTFTALGPTRPAGPANFNSPFSAHEITSLVEALNKGCLVVANDSGYGTLVREDQRKTRNTDFKFQKGELLVADREAHASNGRHNMMVMNSKGEVGDILRTLVKRVPAGMGVLAPEQAVVDGKAPPYGRAPDREERRYHPFPPPDLRARSRSPPRLQPPQNYPAPPAYQWRSGPR